MTIQWEDAVSRGIQLVNLLDRGRVQLGQLVLDLRNSYGDTYYGQDLVNHFAGCIGVSSRSLREYAGFVAFYGRDAMAHIADMENLSYSHMRVAMRSGNLADALDLLSKWSELDCTVDQAQREVTRINSDETDDTGDRATVTTTGKLERLADGSYRLLLDAGDLPNECRVEITIIEESVYA
jgi:hypothetical protein